MKIPVTIPDFLGSNDKFRDRLQQVIDNCVSKELEDIGRRKQISKGIDNFQEAIKEIINAR